MLRSAHAACHTQQLGVNAKVPDAAVARNPASTRRKFSAHSSAVLQKSHATFLTTRLHFGALYRSRIMRDNELANPLEQDLRILR